MENLAILLKKRINNNHYFRAKIDNQFQLHTKIALFDAVNVLGPQIVPRWTSLVRGADFKSVAV